MDALVARLYDSLDLAGIYGKPFPKAVEPFLVDVEVFFNEHLTLAQVPKHVRPALDSFLSVLEENRLLPYGAMIRNATTQLLEQGPIAELDAVYVDEYQDVNPAQTALIKAMLPAECGLRVVGDDLQSIYNWRGSDVTRILDFDEEYSPADVVFVYRVPGKFA